MGHVYIIRPSSQIFFLIRNFSDNDEAFVTAEENKCTEASHIPCYNIKTIKSAYLNVLSISAASSMISINARFSVTISRVDVNMLLS